MAGLNVLVEGLRRAIFPRGVPYKLSRPEIIRPGDDAALDDIATIVEGGEEPQLHLLVTATFPSNLTYSLHCVATLGENKTTYGYWHSQPGHFLGEMGFRVSGRSSLLIWPFLDYDALQLLPAQESTYRRILDVSLAGERVSDDI